MSPIPTTNAKEDSKDLSSDVVSTSGEARVILTLCLEFQHTCGLKVLLDLP